MALRIFIGWDSREPECADVLRYSLEKHSSIPLDIRYLKLPELDFDRPWDPLQSTEFTYTRFLVPSLCDYQGKAVFMDCDMLCLGDIRELDELPMEDLALRVVKHDHRPTEKTKMDGKVQTVYPRKNWSSLMLMNCAELGLWRKRVVEMASGAYLHRFQEIPDEKIGEIPILLFTSLQCFDCLLPFGNVLQISIKGYTSILQFDRIGSEYDPF